MTPLPGHDEELALLTDAARSAGAVALRYWRRSPQVWDKGEEGPVSEGDLAVNDHLRGVLLGARPGYGWLSEEGPDDPGRLSAPRAFVIDPIDGTRSYIEGQEGFTVSIALAEAGRAIAGVVLQPPTGRLWAATADGPATRDGAAIHVAERAAGEARVLTARASLDPVHWRGGAAPPLQRAFRPSVAWRLCLVADGSFDAALSLKPAWEWDLAAGALIAARAGAVLTDRRGAPLRVNSAAMRTDGLIAAGPALHAALFGALA